MAEPERTHLRTVEGPNGTAEIFEVQRGPNTDAAVGGDVVDYEVVFNQQTQKVAALGEASLIAEELAGGR
jgi:hypothetical protein